MKILFYFILTLLSTKGGGGGKCLRPKDVPKKYRYSRTPPYVKMS